MKEWIVGGAVIAALVVVQFTLWLRVFAPKQRKGERQRVRITYRYETPRIEGCPAHIAGEDVAGVEQFSACGRS